LWKDINEVLGVNVGHDFESVAKSWLNENKFKLVNICTTAILWSLWKTRNDMIFSGHLSAWDEEGAEKVCWNSQELEIAAKSGGSRWRTGALGAGPGEKSCFSECL
jgi:hypothetical protein